MSRIVHAYLDELATIGVYGRGKGGVIRRFIEDGIQKALADHVISPKNLADFKGLGAEPLTVDEVEE